ncbi:MAG: hypothetical protein ACREIY_02025 [Candidatus Rokuibacteriota bacterium]
MAVVAPIAPVGSKIPDVAVQVTAVAPELAQVGAQLVPVFPELPPVRLDRRRVAGRAVSPQLLQILADLAPIPANLAPVPLELAQVFPGLEAERRRLSPRRGRGERQGEHGTEHHPIDLHRRPSW